VAAFFDTHPSIAMHENSHCDTGYGRDQKSSSVGDDYSHSGPYPKAMTYPKQKKRLSAFEAWILLARYTIDTVTLVR
jgi:hypothetical protein